MYWWLYPSRIVAFILIPLFLGSSWLGDSAFALYGHPANYISDGAFWAGLCGLALFSLTAWSQEPRSPTLAPITQIPLPVVRRFLSFFLFLAIASNILFLFPAFANPSMILDLASGSKEAMYTLRSTLNRIPGITSFVALQSICAVLYVRFPLFTGQKTPPLFHAFFALLFVLCFLRAWLWSERLATLEIILPMVVCFFTQPQHKKRNWLILAPVFGLVGLLFVFSIGEYFRSWQHYKEVTTLSFPEFISMRFAGYYATALNNGASIFTFLEPAYTPVNTLEWFFKLPIWGVLDVTFDGNIFTTTDDWSAFLRHYGNAEYNNPSGLFLPFYDLGLIPGMLLWAVLGAVSGKLFFSLTQARFWGQIFYPLWFVGVLEILRIFYWGQTRFFPVILAAALVAATFNMKAGRRFSVFEK